VGVEAREGTEAAGDELHRIERAGLDRRDARVGLMRGLALHAVVGRVAAAEGRIFAARGRAVVVFYRRFQPGLGDTAGARERRDAFPALEVAVAKPGTGREGRRPNPAQPVPPDE